MNTPALLQPHLLETSVLRDHLKMRCLPVPNIDQLSRPELLRIFGNFAVPMHKRTNIKTNAALTVNVSPPTLAQKCGSKRKHERITTDNVSTETKGIESNLKQCTISQDCTSIEEVTRNCKQIRLGSDEKPLKRHIDQMETNTAVDMKRQRNKITWP